MKKGIVIPESEVKNAIMQLLTVHQIYHFRQNVGMFKIRGQMIKFGHIGQSDILGMLPGGRFLAIECKASNGRPSPAQLDYLKTINDAGGIGILAFSVDDVVKRLRAEGFKI